MIPANVPADESQRLRALQECAILDTLPEASFDRLTALAAYLCGAPIALISLVDENRQWFKSKVGITAEETSRDVSFCAHAILGDDLMVIPDALDDERFADNPLVTEPPRIRFYAGAPLRTRDGHHLGTLCVIDTRPRHLDLHRASALRTLAQHTAYQLEVRRHQRTVSGAVDELAETCQRLTTERDELAGVLSTHIERLGVASSGLQLALEDEQGPEVPLGKMSLPYAIGSQDNARSGITRELGDLLQGIRMQAEALREGGPEAMSKTGSLEAIIQASTSGKALVDRILEEDHGSDEASDPPEEVEG